MKITYLAKVLNEKIILESAIQKVRLKDFLKENNGRGVRVTIEDKEKPKSQEILGLYWGALLPLIIAHNKNLVTTEMLVHSPFILETLVHEGKITPGEVDDLHATLMTEFRPYIVFDLNGSPLRQRGKLSKMTNRDMSAYVSEVIAWMIEQGYPELNTKAYKDARDNPQLR